LGTTDVDFELEWIHGFRSHDCRNNVLYSASGFIVYNAAALAVVYNKGTGTQKFLLGAHSNEVVGFAAHPVGKIFATSELGTNPNIVVWDSKDMQLIRKFENVHNNGLNCLF
jgi:microtubule-associated protein-like 6